jgi:hypothetical protein
MIGQETLLLLQEYQIDYTVSKASQIPIRSQTRARGIRLENLLRQHAQSKTTIRGQQIHQAVKTNHGNQDSKKS